MNVENSLGFLSLGERNSLAVLLHLSPRELLVAELALSDSSDESIATTIGISKHTVHTHLDRIYKKTGVHSRCQLAMLIFRAYVTRMT